MQMGAGMKVVVAPQALKGSLDAPDVGDIIAATLAEALPAAQIIVTPVADGGEGTARALVAATSGRLRSTLESYVRGRDTARPRA